MLTKYTFAGVVALLFALWVSPAFSSENSVSLTNHWIGYLCLLIFVAAYSPCYS